MSVGRVPHAGPRRRYLREPVLLLIAEQDNLIGQTVHLIGVMANENDGDPSVAKILHQALDVSARRGVEPCTWFVQHQHRRIAGDDPAMATSLCWPPDSSNGFLPRRSDTPTRSKAQSTRSRTCAASNPGCWTERHIVGHRFGK